MKENNKFRGEIFGKGENWQRKDCAWRTGCFLASEERMITAKVRKKRKAANITVGRIYDVRELQLSSKCAI